MACPLGDTQHSPYRFQNSSSEENPSLILPWSVRRFIQPVPFVKNQPTEVQATYNIRRQIYLYYLDSMAPNSTMSHATHATKPTAGAAVSVSRPATTVLAFDPSTRTSSRRQLETARLERESALALERHGAAQKAEERALGRALGLTDKAL